MNVLKYFTTQRISYLLGLVFFVGTLLLSPAISTAAVSQSSDNTTQSGNLLTQAEIPADINPNANVSTTTVPPSEVSTSSSETRSSATSSDNQISTTTNNSENQPNNFRQHLWTLLIGLLAAGSLLYAVSGR